MGTCAVGGEAVGVAAANAALRGFTPRSMAARICTSFSRSSSPATCMSWARRTRIRTTSPSAPSVSAGSEQPGFEAKNVISGVTRREGEQSNLWRSAALGEGGETLTLTLAEPAPVHEVRLVFDPDLSEERCISVSKAFIMKEPRGVAQTLVRDYRVELLRAARRSLRRPSRPTTSAAMPSPSTAPSATASASMSLPPMAAKKHGSMKSEFINQSNRMFQRKRSDCNAARSYDIPWCN